jgi:hypothetical protein
MTSRDRPTVASAAIAAGEPALANSFRLHRPRGPVCGRGYCAQCGHGELACCQAAGTTRPHPDRLRWLGRFAESQPPWFWERRLLRPRAIRRPGLHLLRHLSAAAPLPAAAPAGRVRAFRELAVETVVVGATAEPGAYHVDAGSGRVALGIYPERTLGVLEDDALVAVRFERLILATGSYERLPPIVGNDLPGVIGLHAAERYARAGALAAGRRVAIWAPDAETERVAALVGATGIEVVWQSAAAPRAVLGRGKVAGIDVGRSVACDLFVVGVRQPALELALQAGATTRLTAGELPVLVVEERPDWLELRGACAARGSGVPDVALQDDAFVCPCEDVRVRDLRACVAQGFDDPELVKRRTGAMTGPCQGKLCTSAVLAVLRGLGLETRPTTSRPLARPITIGELAADA